MHMADALVSPVVGGTMWVASSVMIARCSSRIKASGDDRLVPLMGVLGAFIFAAQMINFTIPLTGSSGHLGGALLLAVLLGPSAALLTIASVLAVQALFLPMVACWPWDAISSTWASFPPLSPIH